MKRIWVILLTSALLMTCLCGCGSTAEPIQETAADQITAEASPSPFSTEPPSPEPTPEPTPEPMPEPTLEPETPEPKQVVFNDVVLYLDEGFQDAEDLHFSAFGQPVYSRTLHKDGFGTLELHFEENSDFILEPPENGDVLTTDAIGQIVWTEESGDTGGTVFTVDFLRDSDHYRMVFSADEAMNERRDELIDWLIPTLLMMDLSAKSAPDLAPTPTPAPEVLSELRLEGLYTPGDDLSQSPLLWLGADLDAFGYPDTVPERQVGDPIRVLVADYSEIIGIDKVGMEDMDRQYSAQINNRVNDLLKRFFAGEELAGRFLLVTDPAQADVILTITTTYPFAGNYGPTGAVKVYHCYVDVWIWHVGTDDTASFTYQREAENTITASIGATVVWKSLPDEFDNEVGRTILTWFPDA